MWRTIQLAVACVAFLVAMTGQVQALNISVDWHALGKRGRTTSPIDFMGLRQYSDLAMALWSDIQPLEAALYPKIGSFRVQRVASKTET